jgi:hypothetical protein
MMKHERSEFSESSVATSGHYAWKFNRLNRLVLPPQRNVFNFPCLQFKLKSFYVTLGGSNLKLMEIPAQYSEEFSNYEPLTSISFIHIFT